MWKLSQNSNYGKEGLSSGSEHARRFREAYRQLPDVSFVAYSSAVNIDAI
jgi:hypothetical protein